MEVDEMDTEPYSDSSDEEFSAVIRIRGCRHRPLSTQGSDDSESDIETVSDAQDLHTVPIVPHSSGQSSQHPTVIVSVGQTTNEAASTSAESHQLAEQNQPYPHLTVDIQPRMTHHQISCSPKEIYASPEKPKIQNALDVSNDEEGQLCPICYEQWTNSSEHRLVSLKCGHLFGLSCIEKWLKGQGSKKCPQCNAPAKKSDIRTLYAKCLKVLDTTERDRALRELEKEAESRRRAELESAQSKLKYQLAVQECERLKRELISVKSELQQLRSSNRTVEQNIQEFTQTSPVSFTLEKTLDLCKDGGCRILAASDLLGMLVVSHPSTNPLFPGCGIKKISSLDFKTYEYVCIHQKTIKDMAFHNHDAVLLTASLDKTVKLTSVTSNSVIQTYPMNADVWSCTWSKDEPCHFFAGLRNGNVFQFDTRMTNDYICELPNIGHCSPVVALQYLPKQLLGEVSAHGLLVGQLSSCCFCEEKENLSYTVHPLPLEGKFTSLSLETGTGHLLVSSRPSAKQRKVTHMLCELSFKNNVGIRDDAFSCDVVQVLEGGSSQVQISKSKLIPHPDNNRSVLVCAGDESSQSALIWDSSTGQCIDRLKADSPVLDLLPFRINHSFFLSTLTEKHLRLYKWQSA